jgi:DNA-directed RNA polymerase specialized sigma24 family protein
VARVHEVAIDRGPSWFDEFVVSSRPRLRQALVARFGLEVGGEAADAATAWAWEHRERLEGMENPLGYLFRVGQSATRADLRWRSRVVLVDADVLAEVGLPDIDLVRALERLTAPQRVAVMLVHAHAWSYAEVAAVLDVTVAAVTNHVHRGLARLRTELEER